jgi:hypothetical protein
VRAGGAGRGTANPDAREHGGKRQGTLQVRHDAEYRGSSGVVGRKGPRNVAKWSGAPGNEVFALLGRTGTGQLSWRWCLVWLCPPSVAFPSFPRWPYCCVGSFALRSIGGQLPHTVADWLGPGTGGNAGRFLATNTRKGGQGTRQRKQRSCVDSFCVFPFLGKRCGDTLALVAGGTGLLLCWRSEGSGSNPARPRVVALRASGKRPPKVAGGGIRPAAVANLR